MRYTSKKGGQSEVVGVLLILVLVTVSISVIIATGYPAVDRLQENAETERMVNEMGVLDSEISTVALGDAGSRRVNLNAASGTLTVDGNESWMRVVHDPINDTSYEVYNSSIGTVEYESNGRLLAFQGGGVWSSQVQEEGSNVLTPPEFRYRGSTLTLPIVKVEGQTSTSGAARGNALTVRNEGSRNVYPNAAENYTNPIDNGTINVTVQSRYYVGWADYFDESTEGDAVYTDEDNRTATVKLDIEASETFDSGIKTGGAGNTLLFGQNAHVGAYNSSDGNYPVEDCGGTNHLENHANDVCSPGSSDYFNDSGRIEGAGDVNLKNNAKIWGNVFSEGQIEGQNANKNLIDGNATAGDDIIASGGGSEPSDYITGSINNFTSVDVSSPFPAKPVVNHHISEASTMHPGGTHNTSCVDGTELDFTGTCEIDPDGDGTIYLAGSTQEVGNGDTLQLRLDDGNITMAVDQDLVFSQNSKVEVTGATDEYQVKWYLRGDFELGNNAEVYAGGNRESWRQFFIVHGDGTNIDFSGGSGPPVFTGIIYAPGSTMDVGNTLAVYGALILDNADTSPMNNLDFYYDQDLKNLEFTLLEPGIAITYMHISENRVSIE